MELEKLILGFALQNAAGYKGKASQGAVLGKVLAEKPELRQRVKSLSKQIEKAISEVNAMTIEEQEKQLKKLGMAVQDKPKEKKRGLPELKGAVQGKVVTRIPPEPSKYLHLGHALSFAINYLYAKKYGGQCVLRFEDTNPANSKQEYVDSITDDIVNYLEIKPDKTVIASDDMLTFYSMAGELIHKDHAYVCTCSREVMQQLRNKGKPCQCRLATPDRNMELWHEMLNGSSAEGSMVLRLKGFLQSPNYAMRDPVLFRIATEPHFRQKDKYQVWPMYDFENAVEDHLCGVTHILRSGEFGTMRIQLQNHLKKLLGLREQIIIQYGRFNVAGSITKGREIRQMIQENKVSGWDDPHLVTLMALKRRGIQKETFYELAVEVGLSSTPTNIDWQTVAAVNRKILDPKCNRYFFIAEPKKVVISGAPKQRISLKLHPDKPELGTRNFEAKDEFYISKKDFDEIKEDKLTRLMDCLNFRKAKNSFAFDSLEYEFFKQAGDKIIHWLPSQANLVDAEVLMPDGTIVKGVAEPLVKKLKIGDIIQFERFGFCRLDAKKGEKLSFWYTHK